MNKRECFDIELNSLEVRVFIDYKDVIKDSIIVFNVIIIKKVIEMKKHQQVPI